MNCMDYTLQPRFVVLTLLQTKTMENANKVKQKQVH